MILFDRIARLQFGPPGSAGLSFKSRYQTKEGATRGFRIVFKIERDTSSMPNKGTISIYNLSPTSRKFAEQDGIQFSLFAGYGENAKLIFKGDAGQVLSETAGSDIITKAELGDGLKNIQKSRVDLSFAEGSTVSNVLTTLVSNLGYPEGEISDVPEKTYSNGLSLTGTTKENLDYVTASAGLEWSVQNGAVQIVGKKKPTKESAYLLSAKTGLIGSPKSKSGGGVEATCLLLPDLAPGRLVQFDARELKGVFRVAKVTHDGDTEGQNFFTKIEVE